MNDSRSYITLDFRNTHMPVVVKAKKYDTARTLYISLSDGGTPYIIAEGCYATFTAKKPDGTKINNECAIENNLIEYAFTEQTCACSGRSKAEIKLYGSNGRVLTSASFVLEVYDTVFQDGDIADSASEMNTLDQLIVDARGLKDEMAGLVKGTGELKADLEQKVENGFFNGKNGKSAYQYAVEAGYRGSEKEFAKLLASYSTAASNIVFPNGLKTTYAIGKVKLENGMGTLVEPGGTLADFFNVFIDEKNPATVQPSVSLSFPQADAYEVGEKITPSYSASLNPGSYTYGPATGVSTTSWEVTDSKGNTSETASGSFPEIQVTDGMSYTITAKAEHTAGADPLTNTGNKYEAGKIPAGSKKKTSGAVTGYRNTFYGTLTEKGTLDSGKIRGLNQSKKALADGNKFTITVPVGALRVVFAYPATLRDVTGVKDDAMGMPIETGFTKSTMDINGANGYDTASYKVYVMDFAGPLDTANTYTVTI